MGIIEDVFKALDRIPIWKRLQEVPDEVERLKTQVAELESKLGGKYPPDVCRFCGARASRLVFSAGPTDKGAVREEWECSECSRRDLRLVKPR